ncbi:MAG: hypothetical protein OXT67_11090, partial [Zetaproteobacteria bacterium]|nr:hypothetical protein [Zetaproteobacteria bacterium]
NILHKLTLMSTQYYTQTKEIIDIIEKYQRIGQIILPIVMRQQSNYLQHYQLQISKWEIDMRWKKISSLSPEALEILTNQSLPSLITFEPFKKN